jgi:hypothetical protein
MGAMWEQPGSALPAGRGRQPDASDARATSPDLRESAERDEVTSIGDVSEEELLTTGHTGGPPPGYDTAQWQRAQMRQLLREFLRAVPRSEEEATIAVVRPDGTVRVLKRAQLSAAIDRLRPRQRQIVRLAVEERWPRQRVCEYLHNISIKTLERDQAEALDILASL